MEVRLEAQAGPRRTLADAAEQRQRRIDVLAALHVDPDHVAARLGAIDEGLQVCRAGVGAEVESELRQLDRHLRIESRRLDAVEQLQVVLGHLVGFGN